MDAKKLITLLVLIILVGLGVKKAKG